MKIADYNLSSIFPTPFARVKFEGYEDLNVRIVEWVREKEAAGEVTPATSDQTTNWGNCFQIQLFREKVPVIDEFAGHVRRAFTGFLNSIGLADIKGQIRHTGWIVVSRQGGYNSAHVHPHGTFTTIYHVRVPHRPFPQGYVEFINPVGSATLQSFGQPTELVAPEEGTLLIVPSYLMHAVHPVDGDAERISLNMDYTIIQPDSRAVSGFQS